MYTHRMCRTEGPRRHLPVNTLACPPSPSSGNCAQAQTARGPGRAFASPEDNIHLNFNNRYFGNALVYHLCFSHTEGTENVYKDGMLSQKYLKLLRVHSGGDETGQMSSQCEEYSQEHAPPQGPVLCLLGPRTGRGPVSPPGTLQEGGQQFYT